MIHRDNAHPEGEWFFRAVHRRNSAKAENSDDRAFFSFQSGFHKCRISRQSAAGSCHTSAGPVSCSRWNSNVYSYIESCCRGAPSRSWHISAESYQNSSANSKSFHLPSDTVREYVSRILYSEHSSPEATAEAAQTAKTKRQNTANCSWRKSFP